MLYTLLFHKTSSRKAPGMARGVLPGDEGPGGEDVGPLEDIELEPQAEGQIPKPLILRRVFQGQPGRVVLLEVFVGHIDLEGTAAMVEQQQAAAAAGTQWKRNHARTAV